MSPGDGYQDINQHPSSGTTIPRGGVVVCWQLVHRHGVMIHKAFRTGVIVLVATGKYKRSMVLGGVTMMLCRVVRCGVKWCAFAAAAAGVVCCNMLLVGWWSWW